jgi:two-component system response regulator DctR
MTDNTVFVIEPDASSREAICTWVHAMNLRPTAFASADAFLRQYRDQPGCVVADLNSSDSRGVGFQDLLRQHGQRIPVIALTEHPRTSSIVQAVKQGAATVLDKPPRDDELQRAILDALALDAERRQKRDEQAGRRQRLDSLTDKERDVLRMIVAGRPNKAMANQLSASLRTVENRRREVFRKLGVRSVAELVVFVLTTEREEGS